MAHQLGVPLKLAIVGAGWAGLAAAVEAVQAGHQVQVFEMAPALGGRARRLADSPQPGLAVDNGQHILIGAYHETLRLMRAVELDPELVLQRRPLALCDAQGRGLALPAGPAVPAFLRGVLAMRHWPLGHRLALLATAARWRLQGFRCAETATVLDLCAHLPAAVKQELILPLCVAALNTPADRASGQVWLTVLRDALFSGPGASDLLLPRMDLGALFPDAAARWLQRQGMPTRTGARASVIQRQGHGWVLRCATGPDATADAVVLAASPTESARLAEPHAPLWAAQARALPYEAIITVLVRAPGRTLPQPMVALQDGPLAPAQYLFDLGQMRDPDREPGAAGCHAAVISGAHTWLSTHGLAAAGSAVARQLEPVLGKVEVLHCLSEKRATLLCSPGLRRPSTLIAPGLAGAGDYIESPYPSTLEAAVRSGVLAVRTLSAPHRRDER